MKIIKKIKNCFASHKEIDSDVFEDSRSMLIIGSSNTSKTALLINHLRNTKNRSKKALVIFPAYHSQEIKELNVLENIEVVTHSEDYYFTNRAEIINAVKHGIEDGRDIYLDDMPLDVKIEIMQIYFNRTIDTDTKSKLCTTLQSVEDLEEHKYFIGCFDAVLFGGLYNFSSFRSAYFLNKLTQQYVLEPQENLEQLRRGEFVCMVKKYTTNRFIKSPTKRIGLGVGCTI